MKHPQDYFGTADAIYILSDSAQNHISEEEWFKDEITRTYALNGNSVYYLEVWDYVIFTALPAALRTLPAAAIPEARQHAFPTARYPEFTTVIPTR